MTCAYHDVEADCGAPARDLTHQVVDWLGDLERWRAGHRHGACDCTPGGHIRRHRQLMEAKRSLLADIEAAS